MTPTPTFYTSYTFDIATGLPLTWEEEPYFGKWEKAKKGREAQAQVTNQSLANSKTDQANRAAQYNASQPEINALDIKPGGLSDAASAELAAAQRKIQDTYNNTRAVGLQRIAQHGMGTLTGETSSLNNSLARGQASDEVAAHEAALEQSHQDSLAALNARTGLQSIYNPNQALGTAAQSAMDQAQMGSTLGDIGKGLTTLGSLASYSVPGTGLTLGGGSH